MKVKWEKKHDRKYMAVDDILTRRVYKYLTITRWYWEVYSSLTEMQFANGWAKSAHAAKLAATKAAGKEG